MEDITIDNSSFESLAELIKSNSVPKLTQICRVCLCETNNGDQKLDGILLMSYKPQEIRTMIQQSTGIKIVDLDILPNKICETCLNTLSNCYKLRSQAQRSDEILNQYLKELSLKLNSNSLPSTDLTIHIKGKKIDIVPAQNINQIDDFQVTVLNDKPEIVRFVFHCEFCMISFTNQVDLEEHTDEHMRSKKTFICEYCGKLLSDRGLLKHVQLHHEINNLKCDKCEKSFNSRPSLKKHQRIYCVSLELIQKCKVRPVDVNVEEIIAAGEKILRDTKITCVLCKENYKNHENFALHFPKHKDNLSCSICQRDFQKVVCLEKHVRVHLHKKMYTCPICSRPFYAKKSLELHVQHHTKKKDHYYRCNECHQDFFKLREFKPHVIKHLAAAKNAKRKFKTKQIDDMDVDEMENNDNTEWDSNTSDESENENEDKDEMTTTIEPRSPEDKKAFQFLKEEIESDGEIPKTEEGHKAIEIKMEFPPIDLTDSNEQCQTIKSEIEMQSASNTNLDTSANFESFNNTQTEFNDTKVKSDISDLSPSWKLEKPELDLSADEEYADDSGDNTNLNESETYTQSAILDLCKIKCHVPGCQMELPNFRAVLFHFSNDHIGNKQQPFECAVCFEKFRNKKLIYAHIKNHYTFKCPICLKILKCFPSFSKHITSVHLSNRYKCPKCDKTFGESGNLKAHMITHGDEKQFVCTICEKGFFSHNGLYLHSKSHRDIKELQCGNCGRQLLRKDRLAKHMAICVLKKKVE